MPTTNAKIAKQPTYRLRPDYGQAIVTLTDAVTRKRKDYWLGEYESPASYEMYRRVLAAWEGTCVDSPPSSIACAPYRKRCSSMATPVRRGLNLLLLQRDSNSLSFCFIRLSLTVVWT